MKRMKHATEMDTCTKIYVLMTSLAQRMRVVGELPAHTVVTAEIMHDAEKASFIK